MEHAVAPPGRPPTGPGECRDRGTGARPARLPLDGGASRAPPARHPGGDDGRVPRRRSVSATFLLDLLTGQLRGLDPTALDVVDLGGGTGGVATALRHGHRVTVIDPSPDALASS